MGHREFSRLESFPMRTQGQGKVSADGQPRRRPFSKLELGLLVPLTLLASALAIFTIVYIIQNGTFKPAAIAALCATGFLFIAIAFVVSRRLRRPDWCRDLESGLTKGWQNRPCLGQPATGYEGVYANIPDGHSAASRNPTFGNKFRLALQRTFSPSLTPKSSWEGTAATWPHEDSQLPMLHSNSRHSSESTGSSDGGAEGGLWTSVFELSEEARVKRLSRHELCGSTTWPHNPRSSEEPTAAKVQIVVTKPEPAASPPRSRQSSCSDKRRRPLSYDPLRSNPVRLQRDQSIRHIKSAQALLSPSQDGNNNTADPAPIPIPIPTPRPRSASPRHHGERGRSRPRYDMASLQLFADQIKAQLDQSSAVAPSPPKTQRFPVIPMTTTDERLSHTTKSPRALRKLPNPGSGARAKSPDLRAVYQSGL